MRRLIFLGLLAAIGYAQFSNRVQYVAIAPMGACNYSTIQIVRGSGAVYVCANAVWFLLPGSSTGISSLNGLAGSTQTFVNDTNLTIVSSGTTHTLTWASVLSELRGGTGNANTPGAAGHYLRSNGTHYIDGTIQAGDVPTLNQSTTGTSSNVTGVVLESNGGTGSNVTTGAAGHYLRSNGTHYVDSAVQAADIPTLNQNTTGTANTITGALTLANTPLTTQGDLLIVSATPGLTRLPVGANGQFVTTNGTSVSWGNAPAAALSSITPATSSNTIPNGDNAQRWNWAPTTAGRVGMTFGESAASIATGTPYLGQFTTLIGSTAIPLNVANSLNGSQTLPALSVTPTWNTTGVATGILENATNTASGAASKLMDLQVGGVSQFSVDKSGTLIATGPIQSTFGGSNSGGGSFIQGSDNTGTPPIPANSVTIQAPVSVPTSYTITYPSAQAAGLVRRTNANPSQESVTEMSGDCSTSGSNTLTCAKVNGVSYPVTGALFPALPTLTATNLVVYKQLNGGAPCGDATHAASIAADGTFGCQSITGSAAIIGASGGLVYNNAGAGTSITGWSSNGTTTITGAGSSIFDMSAGATFKMPVVAGGTAAADGQAVYDSTGKLTHVRTNGADSSVVAATATSTTTSQVLHATATAGIGSFSAILAGDLPGTLSAGTAITNAALTTPNLGTPSAATLTNATGLPISTGVSGLGTGVATFLATPSGANFNSMIQAGGIPISQNSQSAAYTTVLSDAGKQIYHPSTDNNPRTFTIDSNANVAYAVGTTITFINEINTLTIAITADTLVLGGTTTTTGSRTCGAGCVATAIKVGATRWYISGPGLT